MKGRDFEQLTLFPEGSLASRSPLPGNEAARRMTVTSGQKCSALSTISGPLGSLVRMCLESSIWRSTRCLLTWKTKDTPHRRLLFRLVPSMPHTEGTGSLFWPTPSTGAALCGGTGNFKTLQKMTERGLISEEERRELSQGNGGKTNPELLEWLMGYEAQFTKLIPTPLSNDYKGGAMNRCWMPSSQSVHVERERERERQSRGYDGTLKSLAEVTPRGRLGPMNPEWVEWLMGFPIGWTELNVSETQSFPSNSSSSSS